MENDETARSQGETPGEFVPGSAKKQTRKERSKANASPQEAHKRQKHSLWRNIKGLSRTRQLEFAFLGMVALGTVGYLIAYICVSVTQSRQAKTVVQMEHRPKVIFSRPPDLIGTFECKVTDKVFYLHTGAMQVWVKNIRKGDALGAFILAPNLRPVPENKTGDPFYDDPPSITDQMCAAQVQPKMKQFPVHGGEEVGVNLANTAAGIGHNTSNVSVSLGWPPKEPDTVTGDKLPIAKDAIFQLYGPVCVYYFDENGVRYGSCRNYRFVIKDRVGADDYSLSCTQTPINGRFEATLSGYCEN